jgi:ABC-type Fe3+-hydroxamate transport system substrate-binding protein
VTRSFVDSIGREVRLPGTPRRIVSLVPSITETLFALDLAAAVAGVTDYCVHPAEGVLDKPKVGGTKNPRLDAVLDLEPDLVIANREENRRRDVARLEAAGVAVFVTDARDVEAAIGEIEVFGELAERRREAHSIAEAVRDALRVARESRPVPAPRVAALVWRRPYMAVGGDTFAHALVSECGGRNPFAESERRYPRVDERDLEAASPDVILLPTEPYAFGEAERRELLALDCPAARSGRIHVIEGELLTWYGPRMARALRTLTGLLHG